MSDLKKDKETERFYKISYFVIPLPLIAGLIFSAWVLITEDSRDRTFCATAKDTFAYEHPLLNKLDFEDLQSNTLDICKDIDSEIDGGDGRTLGKVRWFVCKGTTCGPGWEKNLARR